ncbi:MmgE/PrpD family protein [Tropicimonas sp. IMCC34011]|uniref:MmgE/PrpD family protein n=1 Tax=Tropicimonas sp. IMCC34011 TaxID=2248759 RepID=UPI000E225978|nr:MmgE/PrpD family protein [Tropicimonas sp. IMCC34011]
MAPLDTAQTTTAKTGPSDALARFAADLRFEDIPANVLDRARLHILDGAGLGLASTQFPFAGPTIDAVCALGEGSSAIIGSNVTGTLRDAAMANGVLIHGLDFDDTHQQAIVHPTAAVMPTMLAIGQARATSGREALAAYCIGMEIAVRIGAAVQAGFHHTGFHATGVIAHFSSAVTAGRLMGSDAAQHVAAMGIAGSTASGIQVFLEEGAWTKRLHPGWAAAAGITAATLAQSGFKAPTRVFEGRFGLFHTHLHEHAENVDYSYLTDGLGERWMMADTALKPYPVCHFIHGAADAAAELHPQIGGTEITKVEIRLPKDTLPIVAEPIEQKRNATNEYEAKFSAPFVVAAMLLRGRFGLPDLTDAALADADTRAVAARCSCEVDPDTRWPDYFSGGVKVTLSDGRVLEAHVPVNSGAGERQLDVDGVTKKYMMNAGLAIDDSRAHHIRDLILGLEDNDVATLMGTLGGA